MQSATLTSMSWAHMILSQYEEAVARGEQALRLAEEHADESARADALNHLGSIAQRRGDPVRALDLFTQSLEAARKSGSENGSRSSPSRTMRPTRRNGMDATDGSAWASPER